MEKPSIYNVTVPASAAYPQATIVYNTNIGALALMDANALSALEHPESAPAALRVQLAEAGFVVDAATDEVAALEAAYRALQQDPSVFSLCIAPTYACNLACPYCYEEGRNASAKPMDEATQDAIIAFAKRAFEESPYERLEIQWYGGEPMLMPGVIERISNALQAFCAEHGLGFSANMVSNATRIGAEEAALLKHACVDPVLVTIDGTEELHNRRRPLRDGGNSFEAVLAGVGHLLDEGITTEVVMNTDKVNDSALDELNALLQERFGISANRTKLNDYYGTFGTGQFCEPQFSLMTHPEYARLQCERFCAEGHTPQEFAGLMQPTPLFCRGQRERYYAIDAEGHVYKCDGRMGRTSHVLFHLADLESNRAIPGNTAPAYPFDDAACCACTLLPVCKGTCEWERKQCTDGACHPLKTTLADYLHGWLNSFGPVEIPESGFLLLAPDLL